MDSLFDSSPIAEPAELSTTLKPNGAVKLQHKYSRTSPRKVRERMKDGAKR
jgi:hypothetical protein